VLDLATRMVVGWQMAAHMRTSLIIDALEMARAGGHVQPGAVFHSDQYTSAEFHQYCQRIRVKTSVGRTGVCWDCEDRGCAAARGLTLAMTGPAGVLALTCRPRAVAFAEAAGRVGSDLIGA